MPGHGGDLALTVLRFVGVHTLLDVGTAVFSQAIDQASQFMGSGGDGFRSPKACLQTPEKGAQGTLGVVHTAGGKAQGDRTQCVPGRTRRARTFPPEIWCCGHRPSQRQQGVPLGPRGLSVPPSLRRTQAVLSSLPSIGVKSTLAMR